VPAAVTHRYGAEERNGPPYGLGQHSVDYYLRLLHNHGFNALRLPFCHENVLSNHMVYMATEVPRDPQLSGVPYMHMLLMLVRAAARHGMLVTLAAHRVSLAAGANVTQGMWYTDRVDEEKVILSWQRLARLFCSEWNVMGVDLQVLVCVLSFSLSLSHTLSLSLSLCVCVCFCVCACVCACVL
jgi:endoglucanase